MNLFATVAVVFLLLVISELLWRSQRLHGEISRKFVHITVGSFVAFWPYILTTQQIKLLSLAFVIVAMLSKYLHIFKAIHSVQRPTWGEFWFAIVVGVLAFNTGSPHIFTAALLIMSLADGLAAVTGIRYGNSNRYVVFGSPKSIVGTVTFFVVTICILIGYANMTVNAPGSIALLGVALSATLFENIAIHGFDNLVVPLFVAAILSQL